MEFHRDLLSWLQRRWFALAAMTMLAAYQVIGYMSAAFQSDSEQLVTLSATLATEAPRGVYEWGGFMVVGEPGTVYFSQWALQFKVIGSIARVWPGSLETYFALSRITMCTFSVAVLMLLIWSVRRELGSWVAMVLWIMLLASAPLAYFAPNLYWCLPLLLLPMTLGWWLYRPLSESGRRGIFLVILGIAVFLKALCGFEYLTTITLGALVPIVYTELSSGASTRQTLVRSLQAFAAQVAGFTLALIATVQQAATTHGSWIEGLGTLRATTAYLNAIAVYRLGVDVFGEPISLKTDIVTYIRLLMVEGQPLIFALAIACVVTLAKRATFSPSRETSALYLVWSRVIALALVASLSWNTLMWGHMRYHLHINFVTHYLSFNIAAFILLGVVLDIARNGSDQTEGTP